MTKRSKTRLIYAVLLVFYACIVYFALFKIVPIDVTNNIIIGGVFELIGICALGLLLIGNGSLFHIKIGYMVPLIICNVIYAVALHLINLLLTLAVAPIALFFVNIVCLFIFCLVSIPMLHMGQRK